MQLSEGQDWEIHLVKLEERWPKRFRSVKDGCSWEKLLWNLCLNISLAEHELGRASTVEKLDFETCSCLFWMCPAMGSSWIMDEPLCNPMACMHFVILCTMMSVSLERVWGPPLAVPFAILLVWFNLILALPPQVGLWYLLLVSHLLPALLPCELTSLDGSVMAHTCPACTDGEKSQISPKKLMKFKIWVQGNFQPLKQKIVLHPPTSLALAAET